jgi:hypothetical protein
MKMAKSRISEIERLNQILWSSLSLMECFVGSPCFNESERKKVKSMDAIDWFCANVKNRLEIIRKRGQHPELFEPVLCHKELSGAVTAAAAAVGRREQAAGLRR